MRIVVVEDEAATRRSIIRLLGRIDSEYTVVGESDNGYDGMRLIESLQPDVVITDIKIPRVNGIDMMSNAQPCSPHTKFIILSGYAEFELAKQAMRLLAIDYLLKPIRAEQLAEALELARSRLGPPAGAADRPEPPAASSYSPMVAYMVEDMKANYAQRIYLEDYAERMKVTSKYAGLIFAKETGKGFSTYLRDLRMEKAKEFLLNSDHKIYEIAYKTGYPDAKYFCRVFKDYTGVSAKNFARRRAVDSQNGYRQTT